MITYSSKRFVSRRAADVHRSRPSPRTLPDRVRPRRRLSPRHLILTLAFASLHLLSSRHRASRRSGDAFGAVCEKSTRRAERNHPSPLLRILHRSHRRQPARPEHSRIDERDAAFRPPRAFVRRDEQRVGARIALVVSDTYRHRLSIARARDTTRRLSRRLVAVVRTPRRVRSHRHRRRRDDADDDAEEKKKKKKRDEWRIATINPFRASTPTRDVATRAGRRRLIHKKLFH